jgi:DNA-binding PadR family transcriptional regulator
MRGIAMTKTAMHPNNLFAGHGGFGFRARRGDLAPAILRLLLAKPMHGYEIITTLEAKTHGMWRPSAGAVYPTLQMLQEQELVSSKERSGKRVFALTESGRKQARELTDKPAWDDERIAKLRTFANRLGVLETIRLMRSIALIGTEKDIAAAEQILRKANEKLKKLTNSKEEQR